MTLARLASSFPAGSAAIVCEHPKNFAGIHNAERPAGIPVWTVPALHRILPGQTPSYLRKWAREHIGVVARLVLKKAITKWNPTHIIGVYPSATLMRLTIQAAQECGSRFIPYFFDAPSAEIATLISGSTVVLALTEGVRGTLEENACRNVILVPHVVPAPPESSSQTTNRTRLAQLLGSELNHRHIIAHTGSVENLQRDGLLDLISALKGGRKMKSPLLVLSTPSPQEAEHCIGSNLIDDSVRVVNLSPADLVTLQQGSDVLFATVPLRGPDVAFGKTCFPTKILDYLYSGVPIVVRGPADSVVCRHAGKNGYAAVVTESGETALRDALSTLSENSELQNLLVSNARSAAAQFESKVIVDTFHQALNATVD